MSKKNIVTIALNCGHTRTWDKLNGRSQFFGKHDTVECRHCGENELIFSIIDKAHDVNVHPYKPKEEQ